MGLDAQKAYSSWNQAGIHYAPEGRRFGNQSMAQDLKLRF